MKKAWLMVGLLLPLSGCQEDENAPKGGEVAATVVNADASMCACCGGYFVEIDNTRYRADLRGYSTNTPVWIRFQTDESPCGKQGQWITVQSIRKRL